MIKKRFFILVLLKKVEIFNKWLQQKVKKKALHTENEEKSKK